MKSSSSISTSVPINSFSQPLNQSFNQSINNSTYSQQDYGQMRNALDYIKQHFNDIPDVRDTPMHVGLPLPENDLDALLKSVSIIFFYYI